MIVNYILRTVVSSLKYINAPYTEKRIRNPLMAKRATETKSVTWRCVIHEKSVNPRMMGHKFFYVSHRGTLNVRRQNNNCISYLLYIL